MINNYGHNRLNTIPKTVKPQTKQNANVFGLLFAAGYAKHIFVERLRDLEHEKLTELALFLIALYTQLNEDWFVETADKLDLANDVLNEMYNNGLESFIELGESMSNEQN